MSEPLIKTPCAFGENGNLLLERELGTGGMGGVYMGRDKMLDRPIAVKVMLKEFGADAEFVEKFKREAQSAARLIHPNIAQVFAYGICDGMPYISMELAAGGSLYTIMKASPGQTDVARVLKICQQVAQALQCASDQGCVHGDVKPENILLDANGNAKLVDFGLAGMQKDTTEIWGTPYYISPEKVKKEPVDFRADMYSLGGTLYHALTGVAPFEGSDPVAVVKKRFEGAPKKPSELRPALTPAIDALVLKMLAVRKEDRFPTFEALLEAFKSVLTTGITAPAASASALAKKPVAGGRPGLVVRGRRAALVRKPSSAGANGKNDDRGPVPLRRRSGVSAKSDSDFEEAESSGGVGGKVVGVVFGVVALVAATIGGLVWFQISNMKAAKEKDLRDYVVAISRAKDAISTNASAAEKFGEEFQNYAKSSTKICQDATDELSSKLPKIAAGLKPPETPELVMARQKFESFMASTNGVDGAASTNAPSGTAETAQSTNAAPAAATAKPTNAKRSKFKPFRPPTDEEGDPASPEHDEYLRLKKEYEAKCRSGEVPADDDGAKVDGIPESADTNAVAEAAAPVAISAHEAEVKSILSAYEKLGSEALADFERRIRKVYETFDKQGSEAEKDTVIAMKELWERVYGCQASVYHVQLRMQEIVRKAAEAPLLKDQTPETTDYLEPLRAKAEALAALSNELKGALDDAKGSKDVENVRKGNAFVKSKSESTLKSLIKMTITATAEKNRGIQKIRGEMDDRIRALESAEQQRELIGKENAAAKQCFESIVSQGCIRQLNWANAYRQLKALRADSTTAEGQLAVDREIRKIDNLKKVHDIFIQNLKGHQFKGKLRGAKVLDVSDKEITIVKPDTKLKQRMIWQKFYKDYPGNLNELINMYIVNSRNPSSKVKLSLLEWAGAMTGAALTMTLVCPEVNGAHERSQALMKLLVAQFPEYAKTVKEIFPDMDISEMPKEEE